MTDLDGQPSLTEANRPPSQRSALANGRVESAHGSTKPASGSGLRNGSLEDFLTNQQQPGSNGVPRASLLGEGPFSDHNSLASGIENELTGLVGTPSQPGTPVGRSTPVGSRQEKALENTNGTSSKLGRDMETNRPPSSHHSHPASPVASLHGGSRQGTPTVDKNGYDPISNQQAGPSFEDAPLARSNHGSRAETPQTVGSYHGSRPETPQTVGSYHGSRPETPLAPSTQPSGSNRGSREGSALGGSYRGSHREPSPIYHDATGSPGNTRSLGDNVKRVANGDGDYPRGPEERKSVGFSSTPPMIAPLVTNRMTLNSSPCPPRPSSLAGQQQQQQHDPDSRRGTEEGALGSPVGRSSSQRRHHDFQEALRLDDLETKLDQARKRLVDEEMRSVQMTSRVTDLEKERSRLLAELELAKTAPPPPASPAHQEQKKGEIKPKEKKKQKAKPKERKHKQQRESSSESESRSSSSSGSSTSTAKSDDQRRKDADDTKRRLNLLIVDHETLTTELEEARREIDRLQMNARQQQAPPTPSISSVVGSSGRSSSNSAVHDDQYPALRSYDPDNPTALRRKIKELESHIADLQEANETSVAARDHEGSQVADLILENRALRDEVDRLKRCLTNLPTPSSTPNPSPELLNAQRDLSDARIEMASLRAKNRDLNADLDRLRDQLKAVLRPGITSKGFGSAGTGIDKPGLDHHNHNHFDTGNRHTLTTNINAASSGSGTGLPLYTKAASFANINSHDEECSPYTEARDFYLQYQATSPQPPRHSVRVAAALRRSILTEPTNVLMEDPTPRAVLPEHRRASPAREHVPQVPPTSELVHSGGSTASIFSDVEHELEEMEIIRRNQHTGHGRSEERTTAGRRRRRARGDRNHDRERGGSADPVSRSGQQPLNPSGRPLNQPAIPTQHSRHLYLNDSDDSSISGTLVPPSPVLPGFTHLARPSRFDTTGLHPFAPRSPADIANGDLVKFSRNGGRISKGLVHFVGRLPGRNDVYVGVELEVEDGKHDGTYEGRRYFKCTRDKGVFVAFNKIIMCYGRGG